MPATKPSPLNAPKLPPGTSLFDRAPRSHGVVAAYVIGLVLLGAGPTSALELGEASIKSSLGQALVVQIPYRLAGNERITSACIGLAPEGRSADALPTYTRVSRISITSTHIEIFDERNVVEPLIGLNVDVHCNDAPHFVRSYQLFVDPPGEIPALLSNPVEVAAAGREPAIDTRAPVATTPRAATPVIASTVASNAAATDAAASAAIASTSRTNASPRARGLEGGTLPQGQTYRVVRGDTLSGIAARIAGRPLTISQAADAIFVANPTAFTRGNPDLIEEGRSLTIPNMTASEAVALVAPTAPAPAVARAAEPPATATAAVSPAASEPASAAEPPRTDATVSAATPSAEQPLPAAAPVVAASSAAPVAAPVQTDVAPAAPGPAATTRVSAWLIALVAAIAVFLAWVSWAFVRRRRAQQAAAQASNKIQEPARRRTVELVSRMDVVEGSLTGTHAARQAAAVRAAAIEPVREADVGLPPDLDLALNVGPTDAVDFNVGDPVAANERVDESDRPYIIDAREDTMEEDALTARLPDIAAEPTVRQPAPSSRPEPPEQAINDEQHTLTIVELDMLRQDYETEHTLTQQGSQELRDAVADLEATKKAHAATAETATLESPQVSQTETGAIATDAPTARIRAK